MLLRTCEKYGGRACLRSVSFNHMVARHRRTFESKRGQKVVISPTSERILPFFSLIHEHLSPSEANSYSNYLSWVTYEDESWSGERQDHERLTKPPLRPPKFDPAACRRGRRHVEGFESLDELSGSG
jgi:hypothetical protein